MIKAIIFDCFGVLYIDAHESLIEKYPHASKALIELRHQADYGRLNRHEYIAAMSAAIALPPQEVEASIQHEHTLNKPLTDYIRQELRPRYKIGLLSNIGRGWMQDLFNEHDLHALFNAAVLSGEEGFVKPEPKIYTIMSEKLNVATEECVMIDDILENCDGARRAGMQAIHYRGVADTKRSLKQLVEI